MENKSLRSMVIILIVAMVLASGVSFAGGYENTSAKVETRIGTLEFKGGYPADETIQKAFDQLDVQRAAQAYLEFMPMASMNALLDAHGRDYEATTPGDVGIYTEPGEGKSGAIGLTYNTESVYASTYTDLKKDGPTVIEVPPNVLGVVNDGWMRWLIDLGNAGPDKGKGGKYLLLPPGYEKERPEGYFIVECPTYRNWIMVRGFVEDTGTGDTALNYYGKHFKIYPLAKGPRKDAKYISTSFKGGDTTHPRDVTYFELLDKIVQYEPLSAFTAYELGLLKSLGIEKGKQFSPDARMKKLLAEGVQIGDAIAKANAYAARLEGVRAYPDRKYEYIFLGGRHDFKSGDALWLDARTLFHYEAIVVTPAMAAKMVGVGSQYLTCYRDAGDDFLMGDNVYKLHLPKGIPAKNFWSVTTYHPETRSLLQNGTPKPSISSYDNPEVNDDGSIDIWFAPEAPKGKEKNWIKTIPGEGWFIYIRLYGPLEPYFDQTWKPDDIVKVK
ncbi:MAG: DUF1254 domain-containing protein [Desulfobacteraceae bacterium]|jgi:hypothetical protein